MQEEPKILFVDDEKNILKALRRIMMDQEWDCHFALGPQEALDLLETETFDLIVSDVMMPEMNGLALLTRVSQEHPHTVRIFLTGFASKEIVSDALANGCAQQIIPKPWDEEELTDIIQNALRQSQQQKKASPQLQKLLNSIPLLPPLPESYAQVQSCISEEDTDLEKIADIIKQDVAISSALLHWANTALFGQRSEIDTVQKALVVLGTDIAVNLILSKTVNGSIADNISHIKRLDLSRFNRHSIATAIIGRILLEKSCPSDTELLDRVFTAGLLHDIGKLVEARYFSDRFSAAVEIAEMENCPFIDAEMKTLGTCHSELGSFLAEWWTLPEFLNNVIRWHHQPESASADQDIVTAVHVANQLSHNFGFGLAEEACQLDISAELSEHFSLSEETIQAIKEESESVIQSLGSKF